MKLITLFIIVFLAACSAYGTENEFSEITYDEAFSQEGEYFVFFCQEACPVCENMNYYMDIFEDLNVPIYIVNLDDENNMGAFFFPDFEDSVIYHIIGHIDGETPVFTQSEEDFPWSEGWTIDAFHLDESPELSIIAFKDNPEFIEPLPNDNPQSPEELEIDSTPSILHVVDGVGQGVSVGAQGVFDFVLVYLGMTLEDFFDNYVSEEFSDLSDVLVCPLT